MSIDHDASQMEQNVVNALESDDATASSKLLNDVDTKLSKLSQPERDFMENSLALEGLLPEIAIKTGLVTDDDYTSKSDLEEVSKNEGNSSLKGMAARYLIENYPGLSDTRGEINAEFLEGFDLRLDMAIDTAQAMREFPGLLESANKLTGKEADTENGLTDKDISSLFKNPDVLNEDQKESLTYMKSYFDLMKTPRGIWSVADRSTPRITAESLDRFVDTSVPLGFRKQLDIVQADYKQHGDLKLRAIAATSQPDQLPKVKVDDQPPKIPNTDSDTIPKRTEPAKLPDLKVETDSKVDAKPPEKPVVPEQAQTDSLPEFRPDKDKAPDIPEQGGKDPVPDQGKDDARNLKPNEFGPSRFTQDQVKRDKDPDDFGPQRHYRDEAAPKNVVHEKYEYKKFSQGDKQEEVPEKQEKQQESKFKTIKLKEDATVKDFVRSQLGEDASQDDLKKLSEQILNENDSIDGADAIIKAGDEIKVPKEIELKAVEKEYIVKPGDNLWNISKKHLAEKEGKKPSNREILEQVNKIVERNKIPNPDLIYPDQKIIIPGEVPEEVEPPKEEPKPPEEEKESDEKAKLLKEAKESFGDEPGKLKEFNKDVEAFENRAKTEGLPKEEVDNTFKEVRRLLEAEGDTPLNEAQREKLGRQIIDQAAHPTTIDQGKYNTCNMNTVEVRTYTRKPASAAKVVTDVALTGEYTALDGTNVKVDATPHGDSKSDRDWDGYRSHASEIFQVTTANVYLEQENQTKSPPGKLRYEQRDSIPGEPRGEGLFDYSTTPPKFIKDSPNIRVDNIGKLADVYKAVTGEDGGDMIVGHDRFVTDRAPSVERISTEEGLNEYLTEQKRKGNFPVVVAVETTNEPFWTDSGRATAGGSGGGHVVTITDYEPGPPAKVAIDNSWGTDDDHDASDPVDVHDLFIAMQRPKDGVKVIENDVKEARDGGTPDHVAEFELLRVNRLLRRIDNNDDYTEKLMEALDQAKEDWENGLSTDGKDDTLEKYNRLAGGLPSALRTKLREHRESLGL